MGKVIGYVVYGNTAPHWIVVILHHDVYRAMIERSKFGVPRYCNYRSLRILIEDEYKARIHSENTYITL